MRLSLIRNVKFGPSVKELRVHLCQTGAESQGARCVDDLSDYAIKILICLRFWMQRICAEILCQHQAWEPKAADPDPWMQWSPASSMDTLWWVNYSGSAHRLDVQRKFHSRTRQREVSATHQCFSWRHPQAGRKLALNKLCSAKYKS